MGARVHKTQIHFIFGKAHVAKLELQAILLATQLKDDKLKACNVKINYVYKRTNSTTV